LAVSNEEEDLVKGESMFKINSNVIFREIDDRIVLINLENGFYYSLNEIGCMIFKLILDKHDTSEIVERINGNFEIANDTIESDLDSFIRDMEREKIVISRN